MRWSGFVNFDLFSSSTANLTESSHYTIVAESSNPLMDGTAHNVTAVVLHDVNSSITGFEGIEDSDGSFLALMRIEPEVEGPTWELMKKEVVRGEVMAYGWILSSKVRRWRD